MPETHAPDGTETYPWVWPYTDTYTEGDHIKTSFGVSEILAVHPPTLTINVKDGKIQRYISVITRE